MNKHALFAFMLVFLILLFSTIIFAENYANPKKLSNAYFEITYDDSDYVFVYPFEHSIDRTIKIKNLKNEQQNIYLKLSIRINGKEEETPAWPQPYDSNYLPNEEKEIFLKQEWFNEIMANWSAENTYNYDFTAKAMIKDHQETLLELKLPNQVRVAALRNNPNSFPTNSTVKGTVTDEITKLPIKDAFVKVQPNWPPVSNETRTDPKGGFSLDFPAYKQRYLQSWVEYSITISADGYEEYPISVAPKENETINLEIKLKKETETANYSLKRKYDTGLPTARVAFSKNGKYFATVPFHSSLKANEIQPKAYLHLFDTNGNLVCKYKLDNEIPTVSITDDGGLIATAHRPVTDNWDGGDYVIVIDNNCKEVWKYEGLRVDGKGPSEVVLSGDGKYLGVGTWDGRFYLADLIQKKTLWTANLHNGQVRFMLFDEEKGIYIGSDPNLFYYSINGEFKWKVNIASWPYSIALSENYLFVGPKVGTRLTLINRSDGNISWTYPIAARPDTMLISPDEEYFIYSCSNGDMTINNAFFNKQGKIMFNLRTANSAAITPDSEYIAYYGGGSVRLITRRGNELWHEQLDPEKWPAPRGGVFISQDKTTIGVADAVNGYVYFFEGKIQKIDKTIFPENKIQKIDTTTPPENNSAQEVNQAPPNNKSQTPLQHIESRTEENTSIYIILGLLLILIIAFGIYKIKKNYAEL